jgi:hypothetical protein
MKWWLILLAAGCSTKANSKFCDSTCADPNTHCDTVKHECVPGAVNNDMGMPDMQMIPDMAVAVDLIGADLTVIDLTPPPACTMSSTCPSPSPICDSTSLSCRTCTASDDATCLSLSAGAPHCKIAGTNMGQCVACNTNSDCPLATPTCNPDGTCRKCAANGDCDSTLCDIPSGACIPESDVVYVSYVADPGGGSTCTDGPAGNKDGSQLHPFCEITTALTLISVTPRHYMKVAGSTTSYGGFEITSTAGTLNILGPGKNASPRAIVQADTNLSAINIDPQGAQTATVVIDGLAVIGNGMASVLVCSGAIAVGLTVTNSSFSTTTKDGIFADHCNLNLSASTITGAGVDGLYLGPNCVYNVQNNFMYGNHTGVEFTSGSTGRFIFNSVSGNNTGEGVICGGAPFIADSIVAGNKHNGGPSPGSQFTGTTCTLSNVVTGNDSYTGPGTRIALDPAFVGVSDLHLDVGGTNLAKNQACCIDQIGGLGPSPSPSPLPALDIDGSMRPKGAGWDIGAHEAM